MPTLALPALLIATPAATQPALLPQPPLAPNLAAFPRLRGPGPAVARINKALDAADARVRTAAAECLADSVGSMGAGHAKWTRTVTVATPGPHWLSLVAADDYYCGGPHPTAASFALTYDLQTGLPPNWARLLPRAGAAARSTASDGTPLGTLSSPALTAAYLQAARFSVEECRGLFREQETPFILWPDARRGLVLQPRGVAHAVTVCAEEAALPRAALRALGASSALLGTLPP